MKFAAVFIRATWNIQSTRTNRRRDAMKGGQAFEDIFDTRQNWAKNAAPAVFSRTVARDPSRPAARLRFR